MAVPTASSNGVKRLGRVKRWWLRLVGTNRQRTNPATELEELLSNRANAVAKRAVESGKAPSYEDTKDLHDLARLIRIVRLPQVRAPKRWPIVLMLLVTLTLVSLLVFVHVRTTEIELDLNVSEVRFAMPKEQPLANSLQLSALGVDGITVVQTPRLSSDLTASEDQTAVRLSVIASNQQAGFITLDRLILPAGTGLSVRRNEIPREYRLTIEVPQGAQLEIHADVTGTIQVSTPTSQSEILTAATPKGFVFATKSSRLDIDLALANDIGTVLASNLTISDPSFVSYEELVGTENTLGRQLPTINSGTMYYSALGGSELTLRNGEGLQLTNCQGELRRIELATKGVQFRFVGQVSGAIRGLGTYSRDIMPTLLEWIRANHALTLLWGTTLYVFGLAASLLRWWRHR